MHETFQVKYSLLLALWLYLGVCSVCCLAKYAQVLDVNIELFTLEDADTVKAKYAVNAENFHRNILSVPQNLILMGYQKILKENASKMYLVQITQC